MKALLLNNTIVDIVETEFEVHSSMTWMDCDSSCKTGYILDNGSLVEAPEIVILELTYAEKRKQEYDKLNQWELVSDDSINGTTTHKDAILAIKAKYPKPI
jgi:hypothetical protein